MKAIHALNAFPAGDIECARQAFKRDPSRWREWFHKAHPCPSHNPTPAEAEVAAHAEYLDEICSALGAYWSAGPQVKVYPGRGVAPKDGEGKGERWTWSAWTEKHEASRQAKLRGTR